MPLHDNHIVLCENSIELFLEKHELSDLLFAHLQLANITFYKERQEFVRSECRGSDGELAEG